MVAEFLEVFGGNGHLGVDAFVREVNTAEDAKFAPLCEEFVAESLGIGDFGVTIERECGARSLVALEAGFEFVFVDEIS